MVTRLEPTTDNFSSPTPYALLIHSPKREIFDVATHTNTDPKGIVRAVDVFAEQPWGLYMARPTPGRAQFHHLESWLLPSLGLRVSVFHFNPGHDRDQDYYLDVARITVDGPAWHTEDLYLDLVLREGSDVQLIDVDELLEAVQQGLLTPATATEAIQIAVTAMDGLARNGYDLGRWLATHEMVLTWRAAYGLRS